VLIKDVILFTQLHSVVCYSPMDGNRTVDKLITRVMIIYALCLMTLGIHV